MMKVKLKKEIKCIVPQLQNFLNIPHSQYDFYLEL